MTSSIDIPSFAIAEPLKGAKTFLFVPKEPLHYINLQGTENDLNFHEERTRNILIQGKIRWFERKYLESFQKCIR
jgi:hypothetical protein